MTTTQAGVAGIDSELLEEMSAIAESISCELLHAELKGGMLRIVLDREDGGVTIDDCGKVSREVSTLLDAWDFGRNRYTLEVSSPGLDRPMYRPEDYERHVGHLMKVSFVDPTTQRNRKVVARLKAFDREEGIRVSYEIPETGEDLELSLDQIHSARLEIEL